MLPKTGNMSVRVRMAPIGGEKKGRVHVTNKPMEIKSVSRILAIFLRSTTLKGDIETIDIKYNK